VIFPVDPSRTYPTMLHRTEHSTGYHCEVIGTSKVYIEEKPNEVSIVEMPYAVVHPRTMVVYNILKFSFVFTHSERRTHAENTSTQVHLPSGTGYM
jgi:hypothetical protein